ncbi:MAG: S8 family serine peptidase [Lachnospiraceae bacterium]|nr:S8 family serine peptidase [Lachnospiraceae bacterium]
MKKGIALMLAAVLTLQGGFFVYAADPAEEVDIIQDNSIADAQIGDDSIDLVDIMQDAVSDEEPLSSYADAEDVSDPVEEVPEEDVDPESEIRLSAAQYEEKELLGTYAGEIEDACAGTDYVEEEIMVEAPDEETAQTYADAFDGELLAFSDGLCLIRVANAKEAVRASMDPERALPAAWLNYIAADTEAVVREVAAEDGVPETAAEEVLAIAETDDEYLTAPELTVVDGQTGEELPQEAESFEPERLGGTIAYTDPYLKQSSKYYQWHHMLIDSNAAWKAGYTGKNITVAVLDTGALTSHEELSGKIKGKAYYESAIKGMKADQIAEYDGNGTHVAGIIGAKAGNGLGGCGIAPDVQLYLAGANDSATKLTTAYTVSCALQYAYKQWHPNIVCVGLSFYGYSKYIDELITRFYDEGTAVFCAAGDDGSNQLVYPAGYAKAISVGATGADGKGSAFSNHNSKVRYAGPGEDIASSFKLSNSSYTHLSGTTQANACIAGVAALILSSGRVTATGSAKVEQLLAIMDKGCKSAGNGFGKGVPNVASCLDLVRSTAPPALPTATPSCAFEAERAQIRMQSEDGTSIYYTLDGKTPAYKSDGTIVGEKLKNQSQPVTIEGAAKITVKMIAVDNVNGQASGVATYTYELKPLVSKIELSTENNLLKIAKGTSLKVNAVVSPSYAANPKLRYEVVPRSGVTPRGITVDKTGKVTVAKTCTEKTFSIKAHATDGSGKNAQLDFVVADPATTALVKSITPSKKSITITGGDGNTSTETFEVSVILTDGTTATSSSLYTKWVAKDPDLAGVTQMGNKVTVSAKQNLGKTTLIGIATDGSGKRAQVSVNVKQYVTKLTIKGPQGDKLKAGAFTTLKAETTPAAVTTKTVNWEMTKWPATTTDRGCGVSIVKTTGKVNATKNAIPGEYEFVATAKDRGTVRSNAYKLTVDSLVIKDIVLSKSQTRLFRTTNTESAPVTENLAINLYNKSGIIDSKLKDCITITNSNPKILDMQVSGTTVTLTTTGHGTGVSTITVAATEGSGIKRTCKVYVSNPASKLTLTLPKDRSKYIAYKTTMKLTPTLVAEFGALDASAKKFEWTSSNPDLVSVNASGTVTGRSEMGVNSFVEITCKTTDGSNLVGKYILYPTGRTMGFTSESDNVNVRYRVTSKFDEPGCITGDDYAVKVNKAGLGVVKRAGETNDVVYLYLFGQAEGNYTVNLRKLDGSKGNINLPVKVVSAGTSADGESLFEIILK